MAPAATAQTGVSSLAMRRTQFGQIEDARDVPRIQYPLCNSLLLAGHGTVADRDDDDPNTVWRTAGRSFRIKRAN